MGIEGGKLSSIMAQSLDSLIDEDFVRQKITIEGWTHKRVSEYLVDANPLVRGLSERSIHRFCSQKDIHRTQRLGMEEVEGAVRQVISEVCKHCQSESYVYIMTVDT